MEKVFCQSCGMPLDDENFLGTNKDGSVNNDYCSYCFKDGEYTYDCTMEEMIAVCAEHADKWVPPISKEEAVKQMRQFFPMLKRWKN